MEVTKTNFEDILATLKDVIEEAQFITIDTEFTGLHLEEKSYNYYDLLEELYEKFRKRAQSFLAVQYGICAFQYDPTTDSYSHKAFNFYVFPAGDKLFSCQVSCLHFLIEHGFDFNKLFRDGVPYMNQDELDEAISKLEQQSTRSIESPVRKISDDLKKLINSEVQSIDDFMESEKKEGTLERFNSFHRTLIIRVAQTKYEDKLFFEVNEDGTVTMVKGSPEEKEMRERKRHKAKLEAIQSNFGFSKVIKLLVESRKPLVGHNLFIDLLFTINQFLKPLPNFDDFREMTQDLFPFLFDTKYIASAYGMEKVIESTLPRVLSMFDKSELPKVTCAPGMGYSQDVEHSHVAAYDAYETGIAFLALVGRIGKQNMTNLYKTLATSPLLDQYNLRLSIPRLFEIPCFDLKKPSKPDRNNVFHITFPEMWKREDIIKHFKDYGSIQISWINNTSAFISVKREFVKKLHSKMSLKNGECEMQTYHNYKNSPVEPVTTKDRKRKSDSLDSENPVKIGKKCSKDNVRKSAETHRETTLLFDVPDFS